MSLFTRLIQGAAQTLTIDGVAAAGVAAGSALLMSEVEPGTLSAKFVVDAETDTITLSAIWQVSDDNSTWVRFKSADNVTPTVLATGTGGADAAVTVAVPAPQGVYGWRYVRAGVLVGVTTGAAADTATVAYRYAKPAFDE